MTDTHEPGSTPDVIEAAARYRDRLVAEIEKVDEFLRTASALCAFDGEEVTDLRLADDTGSSRTLH